jgi:hypothetical protein
MTTGELGMLLLMVGVVFGVHYLIDWCKHRNNDINKGV